MFGGIPQPAIVEPVVKESSFSIGKISACRACHTYVSLWLCDALSVFNKVLGVLSFVGETLYPAGFSIAPDICPNGGTADFDV
jgi:hypothetical protein